MMGRPRYCMTNISPWLTASIRYEAGRSIGCPLARVLDADASISSEAACPPTYTRFRPQFGRTNYAARSDGAASSMRIR